VNAKKLQNSPGEIDAIWLICKAGIVDEMIRFWYRGQRSRSPEVKLL